MKVKDQKVFDDWYEVQGDSYGQAIFHYAVLWADTLEYLMSEGYPIEEVINIASSTADYMGITGFMYGVAASVISQCWIHGEEFRKAYNIETQLWYEGYEANENGDVLNPALLNIGR